MKKVMAVLFLMFFVVMPTWPETDQKTIQFLEKLNLYEYCLSREGIGNFTCDLKFTVSDSIKEKFGLLGMPPPYRKIFNNLRFALSETPNGVSDLKLLTPLPLGDPEQDAFLAKKTGSFQSMVKHIVETWAELELKPIFDQETYAGGCRVINGTGGFDVEQTSKEGVLTSHYDSQAKVTRITGQSDGMNLVMIPVLKPSPKGYVLTGLAYKTDKFSIELKINHVAVGKFQLPKKMTGEINIPGVLEGSFGLAFSNYRLNQ
jgi:hypothetical protein